MVTVMHLRDFLRPPDGRKLADVDFARQIARAPSTVKRWVDGDVMPDPVSMQIIIEASGGLVTPNDMHAGLKPRQRQERAA
jgi:hypothetical protein